MDTSGRNQQTNGFPVILSAMARNMLSLSLSLSQILTAISLFKG